MLLQKKGGAVDSRSEGLHRDIGKASIPLHRRCFPCKMRPATPSVLPLGSFQECNGPRLWDPACVGMLSTGVCGDRISRSASDDGGVLSWDCAKGSVGPRIFPTPHCPCHSASLRHVPQAAPLQRTQDPSLEGRSSTWLHPPSQVPVSCHRSLSSCSFF